VIAFLFPPIFLLIYRRVSQRSLGANFVSYRKRLGAALMLLAICLSPDVISYAQSLPSTPTVNRDNVTLAIFMRDSLPKGTTVATFYAGIPMYFSQMRGVDMLGKMDPVIAETKALGVVPGHNKYDFEYSIDHLRPDYVLGLDSAGRPSPQAIEESAIGPYTFAGQLWRSPAFLDHCASNPVPMRPQIYRCFY
jgi:hypothetical protein